MPQMPPQAAEGSPPEEAQESAPQEQAEGGGQDPQAVAMQVGQGLMQLSDMIKDPADKQVMDQIIQMFGQLVDKYAGGAAGPQKADPSAMDATAGQGGIPMGPQGKN